MSKNLTKSLSKSLSMEEVSKLLNGKVRVITYDEFKKYKTLDDALGKYNAVVILYMSSDNYGHYCLIWKNEDEPNTLYFFDPYGTKIDAQLDEISPDVNKLMGQGKKWLSELILKDKKIKNIDYNDIPYQQLKDNIATCGRHCAVRLLARDLSSKQYEKLMKNTKKRTGYSFDEIVTIISDKLGNKSWYDKN